MKKNSERNILVAFVLNFSFTIIEIVGGILTNSIAILSDAVHDFGDSLSIGLGWLLEKKAKKEQNDRFTFGYIRMRTLSAFFTSAILLIGGTIVIIESVNRLINPEPIKSMWIFIIAIAGVVFNGLAAIRTSKSENINEKSINLHILEDTLGWVVVLIGSIFMWAFGITWLDSVMSILVTIFILYHAIRNMKEIFSIFMEKAPQNVDISKLKHHILENNKIEDIHHIHIWTLDGQIIVGACHVVLSEDVDKKDILPIKKFVKEEAEEFGIHEITIEIEFDGEECVGKHCELPKKGISMVSHHHHH